MWATAMPMGIPPRPSALSMGPIHPPPHSTSPIYPAHLTPTLPGARFLGASAASPQGSLVGSRLNWCDMICQTIAEVPDAKLVVQDLFVRMCHNFPEIYQWTDGKNWEVRSAALAPGRAWHAFFPHSTCVSHA